MIPDEDWVETVQQNEETPANLVRYPDSNVDRQLMSKGSLSVEVKIPDADRLEFPKCSN